MAILIGEAHHLVLDRGAVTGADALDLAGIHRRLVEVRENGFVGDRPGVGDPTGQLFHVERRVGPAVQGEDVVLAKRLDLRAERKTGRGFVALLAFTLRKIDRAAVQPAGRSRFETPHFESEPSQIVAQSGGRIAHATALLVLHPDVHQTSHESASGDDDGRCLVANPEDRFGPLHLIAFHQK